MIISPRQCEKAPEEYSFSAVCCYLNQPATVFRGVCVLQKPIVFIISITMYPWRVLVRAFGNVDMLAEMRTLFQ